MNTLWREYSVAADGTHHQIHGTPVYKARFAEVLKFHDPGLAPVLDSSGAYHIHPDGQPAYTARYLRTFGYYEGRAAVGSESGWFHVLADGSPLYAERYAWCGNFQGGLCTVRQLDGRYFHIVAGGGPAYSQRYRYAGDFRDGIAVVQRDDGLHSHIDASGRLLHGKWFLDLDVFHKNHARARDEGGWHHVDARGVPLYDHRFRQIEPFYNSQAQVEGLDGSLSVIDEAGRSVLALRGPTESQLQALSADMVGHWRTQAIRAAVELGVFEQVPASSSSLEGQLGLAPGMGIRLLRALRELALIAHDDAGVHRVTDRGSFLVNGQPLSLSHAASHWGERSYTAWGGLIESLRSGRSATAGQDTGTIFDQLRRESGELAKYHAAMASYARHDYSALTDQVDFGVHHNILDVGGGTGELSFALLGAYPNLTATVMDLPEVVRLARVPDDLLDRCKFIAGNLFEAWTIGSEAVAMARVLHDWPDDDALRILRRARSAISEGGTLYIVEMVLGNTSGRGGLLDLNMLVMTGGKERTQGQFAELLSATGFELVDVTPTQSVSSVVRARAI